jgi:DNA-binding Xre family transcriptional regulator
MDTEESDIAPSGHAGVVIRETRAAEEMVTAKDALRQLKEIATETIQSLRKHRELKSNFGATLDGICEVFGCTLSDLDDRDQRELLRLLNDKPLTELSGNRHVPMCDRTSITLMATLLRQVGQQAKEVFDLYSSTYYPEVLVRALVSRLLLLVEMRFKATVDSEVWGNFMGEVAHLCSDVEMQQKGGR